MSAFRILKKIRKRDMELALTNGRPYVVVLFVLRKSLRAATQGRPYNISAAIL